MAFLTPVALPRPHAAPALRRPARCRSRQAPRASLGALADRVIIRPDPAEKETASGLVLTTSQNPSVSTGIVVSVGPGRYSSHGVLEPLPFAEGQRVLWKDQLGVETIQMDGEQLLALRAFSLVATAPH